MGHHAQLTDSEMKLFRDNCACYFFEIKDIKNTLRRQRKIYIPMDYEIRTSQMQ